MFVGKQFDPVMGVDIHIIQPPGPVPPVPIPHPFIGMVFDPMEFVPILGASIMANGIPRAQAGTTVKAIVPHIPIGGVFVKPPSNDGEIYMGSISVPSEGEPFGFMGCPVLTCQDAGMMPVPRPKRKSKSKPKSMVLPMSVLLPVPKGGASITPTQAAINAAITAFLKGKAYKRRKAYRSLSSKSKKKLDQLAKRVKKLNKQARGGKNFTKAGKDAVRKANQILNGGIMRCQECGKVAIKPRMSVRGGRHSRREAHVDHRFPKSRGSRGGRGSPSNGQVLCRSCNLKKSNKL